MDEERYFTMNNLLISVLVVGVCCLILGFILGVYARKTTEPDATTIETTATTEEIKTTTSDETTTTTEETTTSTTEETTTSETTSISTTSTTKATTVTTSKGVKTGEDEKLTLLGKFKGTYYAGKTVPCKGGSGRTLIDCTVGSDGIKGSVASRYAYEKWGYKANGGRTKLYLTVEGYPSMTGWYYVDDCNADSKIIDFYFHTNANCPWKKAGVVEVRCYV